MFANKSKTLGELIPLIELRQGDIIPINEESFTDTELDASDYNTLIDLYNQGYGYLQIDSLDRSANTSGYVALTKEATGNKQSKAYLNLQYHLDTESFKQMYNVDKYKSDFIDDTGIIGVLVGETMMRLNIDGSWLL